MQDQALAQELARSGRVREAHALAVQACDATPDDASWWRLRAQFASRLEDHADVARSCERMIGFARGDIVAWFNLGVARRALGQDEPAMTALRRVLELAPDHPGAHAELGAMLRARGDARAALAHLQAAARLLPQHADLWFETALAQLDLAQFDAAAESLARVLEAHPQHGPALMYLGAAREGAGNPGAALACYAQAARGTPPAAEAWRRLGRLQAELGHLDEAIDALRSAVQAQPGDVAAHVYLANALSASQAGPAAEAEAGRLLRRALELQPAAPAPRLAHAGMLVAQGLFDEALAQYDAVLLHAPGHTAAAAGRVRAHERRGDFRAALATLEPLLAAHPHDLEVALAYASLAPRVERVAAALAHLQQIDVAALDQARRQNLYFARGALRDRLADYDGAFADFEAANRLSPAHASLADPAGPLAQLFEAYEGLVQAHDAAQVRQRPRARNRSNLPVFIVGMPRTGTSLVEQVLASHPAVYGAGELSAMRRLAGSLPRRLGSAQPYPQCAGTLCAPLLDDIANEHLAWLQSLAPGADRVTDKMPHNFRWLGLIDQLFPGARVIHCVRDARDTCLSIYFQPISPGHPYACDLNALGRYYRRYERLMAHWREVLALPILDVRYEDMVHNHEATVRRITDFCNLPWDARCLRFYEHDRVVNTPSYDQVRRPIYHDSVGRWRHYEAHIGPMQAGLAAP